MFLFAFDFMKINADLTLVLARFFDVIKYILLENYIYNPCLSKTYYSLNLIERRSTML